jgi:hypothetical protein
MQIIRQTFFRPDEVTRERVNIRADLFNRCRLALNHSETDCAFIPVRSMQIQAVRSMQIQAVISQDEIIFVDNQGYRVQDDQGGRIIVLAWDLGDAAQRESITNPVPINIIYFHENLQNIQRRLIGEFPIALSRHEEKEHSKEDRSQAADVIPLKR